MFRPRMATVLALVLLALSACADAPQRSSDVPPPPANAPRLPAAPATAPAPLPPAGGGESAADLGIGVDPGGIESCRQRCERSYQVCGDSTVSTRDDYARPLSSPRLFSQADDCQYQLSQCFRRCSGPR